MNSFLPFLRTLFPLCALCFGIHGLNAHPVAEAMTDAANKFLAALTPEQRAKATFDWKSDERENWHFIPKDRKGLTVKEMNPEQRPLAFALLAAGLSHQGYAKATNIMSLESVLAELEAQGGVFHATRAVLFSVFGKPDATGTWGWRVEGHHFSANFTLVKGRYFASTPSFLGSNPAEYARGQERECACSRTRKTPRAGWLNH
jgi:hypothetical protein